MRELPCPARTPCASCPYRRDVPSGIWVAEEYRKLPAYDGETWEQPIGLFMCHQRDGNLCAGWLACHDNGHLLALRINPIDPSAYNYESPVPIFASGKEAMEHGLADIKAPGARAVHLIGKIQKQRARKEEKND